MKTHGTIKITEDGKAFLFKLKANRVIAGADGKTLPLWKTVDLIANYFKSNNDRYLDLIKMEAHNV